MVAYSKEEIWAGACEGRVFYTGRDGEDLGRLG